MTLPVERTYTMMNVREFLRSLLDPKKTPRVPREVRLQARWLLKHYPTQYDVEQLAEKAPDVLEMPDKR